MTHISSNLPELPENTIRDLVNNSGLSMKDAKTLVSLDDGERLDYFDKVRLLCHEDNIGSNGQTQPFDKTVANW